MSKMITAIQYMTGAFIYGTAGKSDFAGLSMTDIIIKASIALCIIGILQVVKNQVKAK